MSLFGGSDSGSVYGGGRIEFKVKLNYGRAANAAKNAPFPIVTVQAFPDERLQDAISRAAQRDNKGKPDWRTCTIYQQYLDTHTQSFKEMKLDSDGILVAPSMSKVMFLLKKCPPRQIDESTMSDVGTLAEDSALDDSAEADNGSPRSTRSRTSQGFAAPASASASSAGASATPAAGGAASGSVLVNQHNSGNFTGDNNSGVAMGQGSSVTFAPASSSSRSSVDRPTLAAPKSTMDKVDDKSFDPIIDLTSEMSKLLLEQPDAIEEMVCSQGYSFMSAHSFMELMQQRMKSVVKLHSVPALLKEGIVKDEDIQSLTVEDVGDLTKFGRASAFIISAGLFLTNYHVLPVKAAASHPHTAVLFDFDKEDDPRINLPQDAPANTAKIGKLLPERFFWSSKELDAAVVAFSYPIDEQAAGKAHEPSDVHHRPVIALTYRPVNQELSEDPRLIIIQHPGGMPKRLSMHGCRSHLSAKVPGRLLHSSDTEKGSSGSPVLNSSFELVALHRARAPVYVSVDKKGKISLADKGSSHKLLPMNEAVYSSHIWAGLRAHLDVLRGDKTKDHASHIDIIRRLLSEDKKLPVLIRKKMSQSV